MPFWQRIVIAAGVFLLVSILARLVDWRLKRRPLDPQRSPLPRPPARVTVAILVVGLFSALLVIPQVRAIAGGLLASSAVLGLIVGFASQQVLGNFIAGLVIALTQPVASATASLRRRDGTVEEIGMTYTFIRTPDRRRLVVPNSKLASDTIVNSSIRSRQTFAEVTVPCRSRPISAPRGRAARGRRGRARRGRVCRLARRRGDRGRPRCAPTEQAPSSSGTSCACARTAGCASSASGSRSSSLAAAVVAGAVVAVVAVVGCGSWSWLVSSWLVGGRGCGSCWWLWFGGRCAWVDVAWVDVPGSMWLGLGRGFGRLGGTKGTRGRSPLCACAARS